jgi:tetratricopeptide (TPR) repeat protein
MQNPSPPDRGPGRKRAPAAPSRFLAVLSGGGGRIALGLFALALGVRAIFLLEMSAGPLFRIPLVDAETYDTLARQVAQGRGWSKDFFWQPPFYPFFLSLVYSVTGSSVAAAKIVQAVIGAGTCLLTFVLGAGILGRRAGIIAGLIVAFYMPLVFFECDLIAAGLAAFWSLLLLLLLLEHRDAGRTWIPPAFGFVSALAILTRPTFLPFLAAALAWLVSVSHRRFGRGAAAGACLLALGGFALTAIPAATMNAQRGSGTFTILPSSGGLNFYIGNNPNVCETLTARPGWEWSKLTTLPYREGVERRADHGAFYYGKVLGYLRTEPGGFLENMGLKAARFLSSRELPRNVDPYVCRQWSHLLSGLFWKIGLFGFPFGCLLPLAVVGAWRARARIPAVFWLFLIGFPLAVIAVFVADRYRVPMIPILSILAAAGVLSVIEVVRARNRRAIGATAAVIAVTLLASCLPGPFCEEKLNYAAELDFLLGLASFSRSQSERDARAAAGGMETARLYFERAVAQNPEFADAYSELGNLSYARQDYRRAAEYYAKTLEIEPDHGKALHSLGVLFFLAGSNDHALQCLRQAQALDPSFAKTYLFLGQAMLRAGDPAGAIPVLRKGARIEGDPTYRALAMSFLADALLRTGARREGVDLYRQALDVDPGCVPALAGLAWVLSTDPDPASRDGAKAVTLAERAATLEEPAAQTLDALAAGYAEIGRFAEAAETARNAIETARASQDPARAGRIEHRLRLYESGRPFRDSPESGR